MAFVRPPTASHEPPAWVRQTFGLDTRSLAAFRIGTGAVVAADAVLRTRDLAIFFAPRGAFPLETLRAWQADPCCWSLATIVDAAWCGHALLLLEVLAGVAMAVGWRSRWATVAAWLAVVSVLRRTGPATNAGDAWLACLLFWGMFLPLGAAWSWDAGGPGPRSDDGNAAAGTQPSARPGRGLAATVLGPPTAALVLQVAVVYFAAGLAKCNDSWLSGDAIRYALSVHDHGTPLGERLGEWLGGAAPLSRPLSWGVIGLELAGPLLLLACPGLRAPLVVAFVTFHAVSCLTMTIGLFGYVGMVAWMPFVPADTWSRISRSPRPPPLLPWGRSWPVLLACTVAGAVSLASLVHDLATADGRPEPAPLRQLANLGCLHQRWRMFGTVERQDQWAYARAQLADGSVVDLLRGGRPLEAEKPAGGFASLPHHRWHKLLWNLPRPQHRAFADPLATALATDWNRRHPADTRVLELELRYARLGRTTTDDTLHDLLLAAWPPRSAGGSGNLDRLLESAAGGEPVGVPGPRMPTADR